MRIYPTQRDQKKHKGDWVKNMFKFTGAERSPTKILFMHEREQAYVKCMVKLIITFIRFGLHSKYYLS